MTSSCPYRKCFAVTVVIVSRLVYRKGIDLLVGIISKISQMPEMRHVNFLVGGDGPKRGLLEEIREKNNMQDRVTLLGALEHSKVSQFWGKGLDLVFSSRG